MNSLMESDQRFGHHGRRCQSKPKKSRLCRHLHQSTINLGDAAPCYITTHKKVTVKESDELSVISLQQPHSVSSPSSELFWKVSRRTSSPLPASDPAGSQRRHHAASAVAHKRGARAQTHHSGKGFLQNILHSIKESCKYQSDFRLCLYGFHILWFVTHFSLSVPS